MYNYDSEIETQAYKKLLMGKNILENLLKYEKRIVRDTNDAEAASIQVIQNSKKLNLCLELQARVSSRNLNTITIKAEENSVQNR